MELQERSLDKHATVAEQNAKTANELEQSMEDEDDCAETWKEYLLGLCRVENFRVSGRVGFSNLGFRVYRVKSRSQIFGFGFWVFGFSGIFHQTFLLIKGFNS